MLNFIFILLIRLLGYLVIRYLTLGLPDSVFEVVSIFSYTFFGFDIIFQYLYLEVLM